MFFIAITVILLKLFENYDGGISIDGIKHTDEEYADDIGLITTSIKEMNRILQQLHTYSSEFRLQISIKKTKVMLIGHHVITPCVIEGKKLEFVNTFEYLERVLNNSGNDMPALCNRIAKGWASFMKK